jgi:hypothetical protein
MLTGVRSGFFLSAGLAVLLVSLACGSDSGGDDAEPSAMAPAAPTDSQAAEGGANVAAVSGTPPLWFAESLRTMVERYQTIIVGRVEGIREVRNLDALNPTPMVENTRPGFPETVFDVKVLEVIAAHRVSAGQTIGFYQLGVTLNDGPQYVPDVNPLVEPGTTYLFFLEDLKPIFEVDEFTSPAFGRFVVSADRLVIPNGWERSAGVAAVSGVPFSDMGAAFYADDQEAARAALAKRTVDEAAALIRAEIALTPLPPLPTREPIASPTEAAATSTPAEDTAPATSEPAATPISTPVATVAPTAPASSASP